MNNWRTGNGMVGKIWELNNSKIITNHSIELTRNGLNEFIKYLYQMPDRKIHLSCSVFKNTPKSITIGICYRNGDIITINADKKPRVNSWSYLVNSQLEFNYQKDMIDWLKQYNEKQLIGG